MLRGRAQDAGDTARADALAKLYLAGIPQDRRTLHRRIKHLEEFAKNYPQPDLTLTQLADLTRAIAYDPDVYEHYEARMEVLQKLGLVEPALRDGVRWFEIISRSPEVEQDMTPAGREELDLVADTIHATFDEIKSKSKLGVATEATDRDSYAERAYWRYVQGDIAGALADYKAARASQAQTDKWDDADLDDVIGFYPRGLDVISGTDLKFKG